MAVDAKVEFSSLRADSYLLDCVFCPLYNFRYLIFYTQILSISCFLSYFNSVTDFSLCHVYLSNIIKINPLYMFMPSKFTAFFPSSQTKFLLVFGRVRIIANSLSLRLSAWKNSALTRRIFMKFHI
jgi:hypothetical protein